MVYIVLCLLILSFHCSQYADCEVCYIELDIFQGMSGKTIINTVLNTEVFDQTTDEDEEEDEEEGIT